MRSDVLGPGGAVNEQRGSATALAIGRILVPVDFSDCSLAALDHAASLAQRFGASIHVLHVWDHRDQTLAHFAQTGAGEAMDSVLGDLEQHGVGGVRGRLASGDPSETIIQIAREEHYDLIVMGTHGHSGLVHLLHGSVAEKVVRRAPCPVLTVRTVDPPGDRTAADEPPTD